MTIDRKCDPNQNFKNSIHQLTNELNVLQLDRENSEDVRMDQVEELMFDLMDWDRQDMLVDQDEIMQNLGVDFERLKLFSNLESLENVQTLDLFCNGTPRNQLSTARLPGWLNCKGPFCNRTKEH